jgi:hypothetical protein
MDKIADKNRMRLADTDFTDLTTTEKYSKKAVEDLRSKIERATDGGFLIVNDARWADNPLLRDAINPLIKDNKLTIMYPK